MDSQHAFYSADGDFLIVPQHGVLDYAPNWKLTRPPGEICVIPRGIRYNVRLPKASPWLRLELYQGTFNCQNLPDRFQWLANSGDFQALSLHLKRTHPTLHHSCQIRRTLFAATQNHTPFDVVAWKGNYYPYKYDLDDLTRWHDFIRPSRPSIFTV